LIELRRNRRRKDYIKWEWNGNQTKHQLTDKEMKEPQKD
jgi:hypothetical protein